MNLGSNGTTATSGYARIVQTILTTSGPVALIALALAGFLMWTVEARLSHLDVAIELTQKEIQEAKITMHAFVERQMELDRQIALQIDKLIRINQQSCLNNAKTSVAIKGCYGGI